MLPLLLLRAAMPSTLLRGQWRAASTMRCSRVSVAAALPRERITLDGELLFSSGDQQQRSLSSSAASTSTSSAATAAAAAVARPEQQQQQQQRRPHQPIPSRAPPPKIAVVSGDPSKIASVVPPARPATQREIDELAELIRSSETVTVLTGAGISTESGVPDYRSEGSGAYATGFKPMTVQQFLSGPTARARYWTRSFFGWGTFSACRPAASHESIARLQRLGWVANNVSYDDESGGGGGAAAGTSSAAVGEAGGGIITQNVDRLHQAAGSRGVLELHGTTHVVRCLNPGCGHRLPRARFQDMLAELNPEAARAAAAADAAAAAAAAASAAGTGGGGARDKVSKPAEPGGLYRRDAADDGGGAGRPRGAPAPAPASPAIIVGGCGAVADDDPAVSSILSSPSSSPPKNPLRAVHEGAEGAPISVPFRRPDGDVEIVDAGSKEGGFVVPTCPECGTGDLMPDVVFFGDSLPKARAEAARRRAATSDLLLVVGTSVQVFSAFRLVQACAESGGKIAIVNAGPTRADALGEDVVAMRLPCLAGETFARLAGHPSLAMPRPVGAASSAATRPK